MDKGSGIRKHLWLSAPLAILLSCIMVYSTLPTGVLAQTSTSPLKSSTVSDTTPPLEPTGLSVTQIGFFQIDLAWTNDSHHTITGNRIERSSDPTFKDGVSDFVVNSAAARYSDSTAVLGTTYYYRVASFNKAGDSAYSNTASIYMSPDIPGATNIRGSNPPVVTTGSASPDKSTGVTLSGNLSDLGSAEKVLVYFEFGQTTLYGNSSDQVTLTATGAFSITLKNLIPGATYHYRAVAIGVGISTTRGSDATFTLSQAQTNMPNTVNPGQLTAPLATAKASAGSGVDSALRSSGGKISVNIPKGALLASADIELNEYAPPFSTGPTFLSLFELKAADTQSKAQVSTFAKDLQIIINHTPQELTGLDLASLHLYYLDTVTKQWKPLAGNYDRKTGTLSSSTNHFTLFGEMANPLVNGPGRVMASEVNLHSGEATFSYPFELPPGPGGFQPKLTLTYNSGIVDEIKNKRDMASWVVSAGR